jgi:hypothetical protein
MSKLSVYVIAYNDELNMRACLESMAGWGEELICCRFPQYRLTASAHIAAASGISTVMLFDPRRNQPPVRLRPFGDDHHA